MNMKMSDVFKKLNQPMVKRAIFNSCSNQAASNEQVEKMDFVLCAATHAVLNHDRLTSENTRLLDMLKKLTSHDNCRKDVIHLMSEADSLIQELEKGDE